MNFAMEPYLPLLLIGFLPSEVWRWLGILFGRAMAFANVDFHLLRTGIIAGPISCGAYGAHRLQRSRSAAS
jgi:hypothetical protein